MAKKYKFFLIYCSDFRFHALVKFSVSKKENMILMNNLAKSVGKNVVLGNGIQ